MIIGLQKNLYILEAMSKMWWNTRDIAKRFELKQEENYSNVITSQYGNLTEDNSPVHVKVVDLNPYGNTAFGFFDAETGQLLTIFSKGSSMRVNTLFHEWAMLVGSSNEYTLYDKSTGDRTTITREFGEDEHFQLMMESTVPDFEDIERLWEYIDSTKRAIDIHKFHHPVDYRVLNIDLTGVIFKKEIYSYIAEEIGNRRKQNISNAFPEFMHNCNHNFEKSFEETYQDCFKW